MKKIYLILIVLVSLVLGSLITYIALKNNNNIYFYNKALENAMPTGEFEIALPKNFKNKNINAIIEVDQVGNLAQGAYGIQEIDKSYEIIDNKIKINYAILYKKYGYNEEYKAIEGMQIDDLNLRFSVVLFKN